MIALRVCFKAMLELAAIAVEPGVAFLFTRVLNVIQSMSNIHEEAI